jgi:predicted nucleic acid-binding protein
MLAIDTNLIVRYLTGDHPEQSPKARALIDSEGRFRLYDGPTRDRVGVA